MSVAAQEACLLQKILENLAKGGRPIDELASTFFGEVQTSIETPWAVAPHSTSRFPKRGVRAADF